MNKKIFIVSFAALLTTGLTGCGNNDKAALQDRYTNQVQPMGYYSNENHERGNGNVKILNDNDGPITEMMDHTFGAEGRNARREQIRMLQVKDENGNPPNPSAPLANYDRNFFERDNRFSRSDANYHGHLDDNTRQPSSSYYTAYEGKLAEKIGDVTASVRNVEDVRSVVYGSDVLIAVDLTDYSKEEETKRKIRQAVQPYLKGRSCTVVTDEGTFSRIRNIDNDLRDGGPREHIDIDIKNMFRSMKNRFQNGNND
ncbi:YhcN/YlaJ family sporulation lipoprotein [Bacillus methanolicus]|uniref:Spore cortex protein CoxA n=1 Tax=Bacillus methanolicus (strain MGA3 / ATCC 53907) TaxID=796606 RepID=I3ECY2_BACMM|nr:YhcN/YlaJ family sporulation lipoprotein [Bacillus methanolicus]AIE60879.1 spore cortex protein CoxA [Bacillus methanolicus MGA3]EIJ84353.1 Spore cortex protein CoxA [Bacillus methanolicus MGA3]UQD52877.1 spore cortex protein CoxA [Bacillus methanolicus]